MFYLPNAQMAFREPYVPGTITKSGKTRRLPPPNTALLRKKTENKFSYGLRTRQYDNYTKEAESKAEEAML